MSYPSNNLLDYATEREAAASLGVKAGEGNVWRHLRQFATDVPLYDIGGVTAVYRPDLDAYVARRDAAKARQTAGENRRRARKMMRAHNRRLGVGQ